MTRRTRFITFEAYVPEGPIEASHFVIRSKILPELTDGQVLLRPIVFSIDTTQRGMITGGSAYFLPQYPVGSPLRGSAVAEVVESRHPDQVEGSLVIGWFDWADYLIWPFPQ